MGCSRDRSIPNINEYVVEVLRAGTTLKLWSQSCSLRRAHTDPFPLAMRVIQALVMLLGILVDKFPMNSK